MGNDAKLFASERFENMLTRENATMWQKFYKNNAHLFYGGEIEQAARILELINFADDIQSAGEISYLKSLLDLSNLKIERYLSAQQKEQLTDALLTYKNFLDSTMQKAREFPEISKGDMYDYLLMVQRKENQNVLMILYDNRVVKGKCRLFADNKFHVYHLLKVGGSDYQFMEIKAIYILGPIEKRLAYYNEYLNFLPPRQAYVERFGEIIQIEMQQEIRAIERNRHL